MAKEYIERSVLREIYLSSKRENTHHTQEARRIHRQEHIHILNLLDKVPAADVVEVVRCRDCKKRYVPAYCALWYGQINDEHGCRDIFLRAHNDDFYCAYGERKDSADDE